MATVLLCLGERGFEGKMGQLVMDGVRLEIILVVMWLEGWVVVGRGGTAMITVMLITFVAVRAVGLEVLEVVVEADQVTAALVSVPPSHPPPAQTPRTEQPPEHRKSIHA